MKPVYQTITEVDPAQGKFGNCFQACIASVLELPLEDVPHFAQLSCQREIDRGVPPSEAFKSGTDWWYMLNDWLAPRGLYYLEFTEVENWHEDIRSRLGFHLIVGGSPRGDFDHVVVGQGGEIVHDPRRDANGAGLRNQRAYGLFIPVSAAGVAMVPDPPVSPWRAEFLGAVADLEVLHGIRHDDPTLVRIRIAAHSWTGDEFRAAAVDVRDGVTR